LTLNRKTLSPLFLAALLSAAAGQAAADTKANPDGELSVSLGAERSKSTLTGVWSDTPKWSPTFGIDYQKGRFFAGIGRGVGYELVQTDDFSLFLAAAADFGRRDGDRKDSPRLVGMGKIKASGQLMAGANYQVLEGLFNFSAVHLMSTTRSHGSQTVLNATMGFPLVGEQLSGFLSLGATRADQKHAQTYYGVTPAQAARSGNRAYAAKAGWISSEVSLGLNYEFDKQWSATASVGRQQLRGPAALSPLYTSKKDTVASIGVHYSF
jgi:MipA family protein